MESQIITAILSYGAPGVIIAVLVYVCKRLYDDLASSQNARITDGLKMMQAMEANTNAAEMLTIFVRENARVAQQPPSRYEPAYPQQAYPQQTVEPLRDPYK